MIFDVASLLIGLVAGGITGLYFDRRARSAMEQQNETLRKQLRILEATIYSLGGTVDLSAVPDARTLAEEVAGRAAAAQDWSGRVDKRALVAYFVERGYRTAEVEGAITGLCASGSAKEEGVWLQMT